MGNFKNLPTDIVLDIITRLPAESILDCKLVCKPWRNLVSHPSFYQTYLTHLKHSTSNSSGKLSFLVATETYKLYHFDFVEKHDDEETPTHRIRRINFTHPFVCHCYMVIGSINGLVCLFGGNENAVCVCNPVTREYVILPKFNRDCEDYLHWSCGFGYLPTTNEYKVVVLNSLESEFDFVEVAVYTLGSGNGWKTVERLNTRLANVYVSARVGVFVNGALHWEDHQEGKLLAFDLTKEKFREHLSPPPCPSIRGWPDFVTGVFGGVLYYAIVRECIKHECSDIWLLKKKNDIRDMKEQVEHEQLGWSKEFSLPIRGEPLAFTKSGSVLYFNHWSLGIYDAVASTSKTLVDFSHLSVFNQIFPHEVTLLSLKELGEENVQVMQSATRDLPSKQLAR